MHYYDTWVHIGIVQFYFLPALTEYTNKVGEKKEDTKLKHTTNSWNWPYLTSYQIGPVINQFLYVHYLILSILRSPSPYFFPSTTALHKYEKGSCSAISAIQATRDQGLNPKKQQQQNQKPIMKSW